MDNDVGKLRLLLAEATVQLTDGTVTPKTLADLLRLGAEHQRPRADNWNRVDWLTDASLIVAAVNALPALLDRIETLEAALRPFAEIGTGEVFEHWLAKHPTFIVADPLGKRLAFIPATAFDEARQALSPNSEEGAGA